MNRLKIIECQGYTKEEAFKELSFNPNSPVIAGSNATQAWKQAGSPNINSMEFKRFIAQQLDVKTKNQPGFGVHIVLDAPVPDVRTRPYEIFNNKAFATRDWKFVYQIREDVLHVENSSKEDDNGEMQDVVEISVIEPGKVVEECDSKQKALQKAKELTAKTKKSYSILAVKIPDIAPISAFCVYTPSSNAKKGTFIACGINEEV